MATKGKPHSEKDETLVEVVGGVGISIAILIALIWFLGSHKIVYYSTPLLWLLSTPIYFFDSEQWARLNEAYVYYRTKPGEIKLHHYMAYANACLKPLALLVSSLSAVYVASLFMGKNAQSIKRSLKPMEAAIEISKTFPAIIPVLHLGPKLIKNELPLWRRQTFPEEVWSQQLVNRRPMVEKGVLNLDRVAMYFRGGEAADGPQKLRSGRRWSSMLGYQIVDLIKDRSNASTIVFPDRFSPQGKVIYALLCAHAFGGRDGKTDYRKAAEQLNRSCSGQKDGVPNLTVAQWLYDKYRQHEMAAKLFTVHHWEYSFLFALFFKAKLTGKATHTDFIWLKPLDRILFYALNTVGRSTPPVEAAAVFSQFDYEIKVAKANRLPLVQRADGTLVHHIAVGTAVEGLQNEYQRYLMAHDDADDWWQNLTTWSGVDQVMQQLQQSTLASKAAISDAQCKEGVADMSEYEIQASENARRSEELQRERDLDKIARSVGVSSGADLF